MESLPADAGQGNFAAKSAAPDGNDRTASGQSTLRWAGPARQVVTEALPVASAARRAAPPALLMALPAMPAPPEAQLMVPLVRRAASPALRSACSARRTGLAAIR